MVGVERLHEYDTGIGHERIRIEAADLVDVLAVPAVKNVAWPRGDVDRFILARLEKEGLAPSPEADRVTLLRRLSLDLIGLPPTIAEVDAFLADDSAAGLREASRAAAGFAPLRRALGPALARRGPLCRLRRFRKRQVAQRLDVSRLGRSAP